MKIIELKKTTSTCDYIKKYIKRGEEIIIRADAQTKGRGTKNRSFSSNKGGVFMSHLKFYDNLAAKNAFSIIVNYSMAVIKTLLAFGIDAKIKWPNDIIANGKKLCGILTENKIENGQIIYSLVGLGINVANSIPDELKNIAARVCNYDKKATIESVFLTLLLNLSEKASFSDYLRYSAVIGKKVTITEGERNYEATVLSVEESGGLKLEDGRILYSAEIKLHL